MTAVVDQEFEAGQPVEWKVGVYDAEIRRGTLIRRDLGFGGPWLVDVDGQGETLVKEYALHRPGNIRRLAIADAIQAALTRAGRGRDAAWIPFDEILAAADAVIALDGVA